MNRFKKLMVLVIAGLIGLTSFSFASEGNFNFNYKYTVLSNSSLSCTDCALYWEENSQHKVELGSVYGGWSELYQGDTIFSNTSIDNSNLSLDGYGNYSIFCSSSVGGNSTYLNCSYTFSELLPDTPGTDGSSNGSIITSEQVSGMGTALAVGGSSLLRIGIQLLPYAIAFTIILIVFKLIKNWSKLSEYLHGTNAPVNILGEKWAKNHPNAYNRAYRRWDKRSAKRLARKYGGDPKDYYFGDGGAF